MNFLKRNKFIFILLLIVFILRLPSLFEPYWYGDEGIYLTIGMAIKKGYLLYRDIYDNKPPLLYLLTALANGKQFWFRLFLSTSLLASIYFFYQFCLLLFENQTKKAKIATLFFSFLTTIRAFEGNIANSELFILLPTILGFSLSLREKRGNFPSSFLIGALLSLGFLYKVPAVLDFLTLLVFLVFFSEKKFFQFNKKQLCLCLGYAAPIFFTGLFFFFKNSFSTFFSATILHTFGYLSSWKTGSHQFSPVTLLKSEFVLKALLVLVIGFLLWIKKTRLPKFLIFSFLWFIFSLFGATLSGRPYPHYLVQIIPPTCLLLVLFADLKLKKYFYLPIAAVTLLITSFVYYQFWNYPTLPYYQNFLQFSLGKKDKTAYFSYFNPNLSNIYRVSEFIAANSKPADKIFVWADEPVIYALSHRLPATPYLVAYHINDLKVSDSVTKKILLNLPALIIINKDTKKYPELDSIVQKKYFNIGSFDNMLVWKKRSS